jgi:hypothetical protein
VQFIEFIAGRHLGFLGATHEHQLVGKLQTMHFAVEKQRRIAPQLMRMCCVQETKMAACSESVQYNAKDHLESAADEVNYGDKSLRCV